MYFHVFLALLSNKLHISKNVVFFPSIESVRKWPVDEQNYLSLIKGQKHNE